MGELRFKHPLCGATVPALIGLIRRAPRVAPAAVPWLAYYLLCAAARAPVTLAETAYLGLRPPAVEAPLFIVGHWRSGTTHLVNLLATAARFHAPGPVAVGLPAERLLIGRPFEPLLAGLVPDNRWIDKVELHGAAPQEDEIAVANLGVPSFYEAYYLPGAFKRRLHELLFLDDGGLERWLVRAGAFYARLAAERPSARLLIKNPVYTSRLAALHARWPDARFIHCVRHPYEVFASTLRFHRELGAALSITRFDDAEVEATVLDTYDTMMRRFESDRAQFGPGRLAEVRFEALSARPLEVLERVYAELELGDFAADRSGFEAHLARVEGYRSGRYRLDAATRARIDRAWAPFVARWGEA